MKVLIISILYLFLIACEPVGKYDPIDRPLNIPESAVWVGGADGGAYIYMVFSKNEYKGSVYFDSTGELWYKGSFIYSGKDRFDTTNRELYASWDGETIYLVNGNTLTAVDH
ncbi:hypothetical protein [Photobacterium nomapromontoriensis]|uniref:hypothetical protein n=1 Tax=Photobacterium nomapromontoriensis TaxID=2910237 RepID=UPI003D0CE613